MISLGQKRGGRNASYTGGLMIGGGGSGGGARGGGHIRACVARGVAALRGTRLEFALTLVAIVEIIVGSDALRDNAIDRLAVGAVLPNVANLQAPEAAHNERGVGSLDIGGSLCIGVGMQERGVHVVERHILLGDELTAERIVVGETGNLSKTEQLGNELQASEGGRSDALNPSADAITAPEVIDVCFI